MLERFIKKEETAAKHEEAFVGEKENLPAHIAIIMDGNGRWAKQKGLPRIAGHREGMKVINKVVREANHIGIKYLTLYAFSTENWKRPKAEVDFLMRLPEKFLHKELPSLKENNVRVTIMGTLDGLPSYTIDAVKKAVEETKENNGLVLNLALNYGSRNEMIRMVKEACREVQEGKQSIEDIDENYLSQFLLSNKLPDPDLLIRTSGEIRLSNFMLWQVAYSEFWFTNVLWPDFSEEDLVEAIRVYQKRKRRYGGV
ncbi:isoprenyl transferase [Bacillus sp. FJAT-44742]|uniref:isoprenyl transferase n=1 Tax=Bacillus sp. FJAT-44742 TaxID=2014005 RepID=UPI000C245BE7|nr:isoprenyl transferase [Bacillus sp. FJAT-44742]